MVETGEAPRILLSEINYLVEKIVPKASHLNLRVGGLDISVPSEMHLLRVHTPIIRDSRVTEVLIRGASRWRRLLLSDESFTMELMFTYPMGSLSMEWGQRGSRIESLLQNGPIYVPRKDWGGGEVRELQRLRIIKETLTAVSKHVPPVSPLHST